eukprot:1713404-Rhodomonas_salina.1
MSANEQPQDRSEPEARACGYQKAPVGTYPGTRKDTKSSTIPGYQGAGRADAKCGSVCQMWPSAQP